MPLSIRIRVARDARTLIAGTVALLAAAACGSSATGPSTGSLTVTIDAPGGVTPAVAVSGPGGYSKVLAATTTLTGLAAGIYTLTAAPVTTTDPVVGTTYITNVTGSQVTVNAGGLASATATYLQVGGTGGLWIANYNSNQTVVQFNAGQFAGCAILACTNISAPANVAVNTRLVNNFGVAFDVCGDLWVSTYRQNVVLAYTTDHLSSSGAPLGGTGITGFGAAGLAFDGYGDLWVANNDSSTLSEYDLSDSYDYPCNDFGFVYVISSALNSLLGPTGIAFDSHGNLWVANGTGNTLVEYSEAQIYPSTGGALTPAITLTANGNSIHGPMMIAFDAGGNLWVANGNQVNYSSVVEFSAAQLAASGSPTPKVTLTPNAGSLNQPTGLAFDASGDLWVSNIGGNTVVEFTPSQIASSGSPTPSVTVSGASLSGPAGLAFDPPASNLPLVPVYYARARAARMSKGSLRER
jgi:sugar lactone lactonase YvrE